MTGQVIVDLDATDPRYKADPYPLYGALRTSAPVRRVTLNTMPAWLVTRYEDVRRLLADPRLSNNLDNLNPALVAAGSWVLGERMMGLDRKAFTPGRIERLRPRVQQTADDLVARFAPRGEAELDGWEIELH